MTIHRVFCMTMLIVLVQVAGASDNVLGVIGMNPVDENSYLAVYVPLEDHQAISGVEWYNNDSTAPFPSLMVAGGCEDSPGEAILGSSVLQDVFGSDSGWSQCSWSTSYSCVEGGLYIMFHLPQASVYVNEGIGGGAAIGFARADSGLKAWMSYDGQEWVSLYEEYGLSVRPLLVARADDTVMLERADKLLAPTSESTSSSHSSDQAELEFGGLSSHPNPFNPMTKLRFSLKRAQAVDLVVYDIRGKVVKTLASRVFSAGLHQLEWNGTGERGNNVSSGVYFARMRTADNVLTERLVLVR